MMQQDHQSLEIGADTLAPASTPNMQK